MKRVDLIVSALFFLLGAWVLWQATKLPQFSVFGPGPEFMPNVAGILLIALSTLSFVKSWMGSQATPEDLVPDRAGLYRIAVIIIALFLYVALLSTVGYLPLTFAYAAFMLLALTKYRWFVNLGIAVLITGLFYWGFVMVLGVPVPKGIFGA